MKHNLAVQIGRLRLKNPVLVASGTFGYAEEFADFVDLKKLGGIVTKTITLKPREGNPPPRTCETPAGMLNSIGLENPGIDVFLKEKLPLLKKINIPIIVSIASEGGAEEFVSLASRLERVNAVSAIELNISCPNIKAHSRKPAVHSTRPQATHPQPPIRLISQDPRCTYAVVKAVRKVYHKTIITKLSPNVTDIVEIAKAAEAGGSHALSLINTILGLAIDTNTCRPRIATITAGLSGPAIRPVALRMIWEVFRKIRLPLIGMGGIIDVTSALEYIIAGATAVAIGTANFINPGISIEIVQGIGEYLKKNKVKDIKTLVGCLNRCHREDRHG